MAGKDEPLLTLPTGHPEAAYVGPDLTGRDPEPTSDWSGDEADAHAELVKATEAEHKAAAEHEHAVATREAKDAEKEAKAEAKEAKAEAKS